MVFRIGHADEQFSDHATMTTFAVLQSWYSVRSWIAQRNPAGAAAPTGSLDTGGRSGMPAEIFTEDQIRKSWQAALYRRAVANKGENQNPHVACNDSQVLEFNFASPASNTGKLIFQTDRLGGIDATIRSSFEISCQPPTVFV